VIEIRLHWLNIITIREVPCIYCPAWNQNAWQWNGSSISSEMYISAAGLEGLRSG